MRRIVIDTNVLIADAYNKRSSSTRIVDGCLDGRLQPVVSPELLAEYERVLPKAIRVPSWRNRLESVLRHAHHVTLERPIPQRVETDPSDDMLFATATAGDAVVIITNDAAVLRVVVADGPRVLTPSQFAGELNTPE